MISRRTGFCLTLALSFGSFSLGVSESALAQPTEPPADASPKSGDDAAKPTEASAEAPKDEQAPAEAPKQARAESQPDKESPVAQRTPSSTGATDTIAEPEKREETALPLTIERLPGSGYPSIQTRGLKYGSLWMNFHGQQFPYMPSTSNRPGMRIAISGSVWNDLSYTKIGVDRSLAGANINDQNRWATQTRGVLRTTATYNATGGWFAQGNAEVVLVGDQTPDATTKVLPNADDLWVRAGMWNVFDVTVGRFQGWEIANHYGMALDQNTLERSGAWLVASSLPKPTDGYGLTHFWDRQNFILGAYALHVYPTKYLRGELLGHFGAGNNTSQPNQMDVRPSVIFDIGWLKLKGGLEYGKAVPQDATRKMRDTRNGYGLAAQFVFAPYVEFGGSFGRGFEDVVDKDDAADLKASNTAQTAGGFLNFSPGHEPLVFGFGAFENHSENFRVDNRVGPRLGKIDTNDQWLLFGAVQYTLWEQLYLKFVLSHASNKIDDYDAGMYVNNAISGRFRMMFLF